MAKYNKHLSIKFPFTNNNDEGIFIDLNKTAVDKTASEILHLILTPKRTRVRMPDFGTDLMKYIFNENTADTTIEKIKKEAQASIDKYIKNVTLEDIRTISVEGDDHRINLYLRYTTYNGNTSETNELGVKI